MRVGDVLRMSMTTAPLAILDADGVPRWLPIGALAAGQARYVEEPELAARWRAVAVMQLVLDLREEAELTVLDTRG